MSEAAIEIPPGLCHCGCGQPTNIPKYTHVKRGCFAGVPRRFISGHNQRRTRTPEEMKQFLMDSVSMEPNTGCWLWMRGGSSAGYGRVSIGGGKQEYAHRVSYELFIGSLGGSFGLHKCDTPCCINPQHIYPGDSRRNIQDSYDRNRHAHISFKGERHPMAKLTDSQVMEIRAKRIKGISLHSLGREYGVSWSTIWWISKGGTWKHLL